MTVRRIAISEIQARGRFRKDFGDLNQLRNSIDEVGLLQPIVVDKSHRLIAGMRRLKSCKALGWETIPASIVGNLTEASSLLKAERDENTCRKEFTPEEKVNLANRLSDAVLKETQRRHKAASESGGKKAGNGRVTNRGGDNSPTPKRDEAKRTREQLGEAVGMSGKTLERATAVVASGDQEAIDLMNKTGKVNSAYNKVKQQEKVEALEQKARETKHLKQQPKWTLIHGDVNEKLRALGEHGLARLAFTDPPYNIGIDYGNGKQADLMSDRDYMAFCRQWMKGIWENLTDDGSFWLLVSDEYAAELCCLALGIGFHRRAWIKWFEGFGVNCSNNFNRTTRHIFHFVCDPKSFVFHSTEVMRPSDRQTKYGDKRASAGGKIENDLWNIPRLTGTCNERIPSFPTQIPIAIVDRIVRCASDPGDLVIDPFNGSGTTGVAAIQNGRKYIGIDQSEKFIDLADKRLKTTVVK